MGRGRIQDEGERPEVGDSKGVRTTVSSSFSRENA
jgi:hypothetical protein